MSVVVACEDVGPSKKSLTIEVPREAVDAEMQRVVREYSRNVRLPGFRKGKVPTTVVRKRFRREIDKELIERLVPRYWKQAEAERSLAPLLQPEIEDVQLDDGSSLTFVATVEVRPEFDLAEDMSFELPDADVLVGEAEVDEALDQVRIAGAPWETVARAAMRGDRVQLKIRELTEAADEAIADAATAEDGETASDEDSASEAPMASAAGSESGATVDPVERGAGEEAGDDVEALGDPLTVELGDERVWEELTLAATGLEAGQDATFSRREQAGEDEEPHERRFRLHVVEVETRGEVEMTDEWARSVAQTESLDELREQIEQGIRGRKEREQHQLRETALLDQLIERHPFEVPEGVVQAEAESMLADYAESLSRQGVDLEKTQIDWRGMADQSREPARKRVHSRLVLDALAERDEIVPSAEEIELALQPIAQQERKSTAAVRQALDRSGRLADLVQHMTRRKTIRMLLGEETAAELPAPNDAEDPSRSEDRA